MVDKSVVYLQDAIAKLDLNNAADVVKEDVEQAEKVVRDANNYRQVRKGMNDWR